jgi:hypothetical protein
MSRIEKYAYVAIDILDENNISIDKMGEPSDIVLWLASPDSPDELVFFPSNDEKVVEHLNNLKIDFKPVMYIPFEEKTGNELESKAFYGVWFADVSMDNAKQMAKELGLDYFFYSEWDAERIFILQDVNSDEQIVWGYDKD